MGSAAGPRNLQLEYLAQHQRWIVSSDTLGLISPMSAEEVEVELQTTQCHAVQHLLRWRKLGKCVGCAPRAKAEREECRFKGDTSHVSRR